MSPSVFKTAYTKTLAVVQAFFIAKEREKIKKYRKVITITKAGRQTQSRNRYSEKVIIMNKKQNCSRWICCPICGGKTRTKVYEDTVHAGSFAFIGAIQFVLVWQF